MKICWNVTSNCNRNCKYCFKFKDEEVSLDAKLKILDRLKELGAKKIIWGGGEPYLVEDIDDLIKKSHKYGIYNEVITNATMLNKDNIVKKLKYVDKLSISLDLIDDDLNKEYGIGENYYKHVKEILPFINKKYPNIYLQINTVVFNGNVDKLNDLYRELCKHKINSWKLNKFYPIRGMALRNKNNLYITNFEYERAVSDFFNTTQDFDIYFNDEEKMMMRHYIILSSGKLIISQDNNDIEVIDLMGGDK